MADESAAGASPFYASMKLEGEPFTHIRVRASMIQPQVGLAIKLGDRVTDLLLTPAEAIHLADALEGAAQRVLAGAEPQPEAVTDNGA